MEGVVEKKDFSVTFLPALGQIRSCSAVYCDKPLLEAHFSVFSLSVITFLIQN